MYTVGCIKHRAARSKKSISLREALTPGAGYEAAEKTGLKPLYFCRVGSRSLI
jgi:hypothetical protein